MGIQTSIDLYNRANQYIPGGVNSPVRSFNSVGGNPLFITEAKGPYLFDVDGNKYIDYINSWGPMILGHAHPRVVDAVKEAVDKSLSFGTPTPSEIEIAELICGMVPNIEKVRFVNSGTEACMSAIRLARGYTGKNKFIKFEGCYHGHADPFLIKAGSGASTLGTPNSPGVTPGTIKDTLLAPFNNIKKVEELISEHKDDLAAVIVEPVAGNMGCIPPDPSFINGLRKLCDEHGIILIFDEVMTGFRLAPGGAQEYLGIEADIVTYGKVIGGGMPVGAYCGKKEIMAMIAPEGPVYQAGTLSGNPVAMASGLATLSELHENPKIYNELENNTKYLRKGLERVLSGSGLSFSANQAGSMISVHFTDREVTDHDSAAAGNNEQFKMFFHGMLEKGIYLPPSAFESWFVSTAITEEILDFTIKAAEESASKIISTINEH